MARLILRHEGGESEYQIRGVATIGRQATNDITVLDEKASRHHARVVQSGREFFIEDLGSSNGTLLNGAPIQRHVLKHGDVVRIGVARLMFYEDRASNLEGQTVDNYEIHTKIGQGSMGTVYKAKQVSMDRTVALKLLNDELTQDPAFLESFLQDARTAAKLSHPNIVRIHDFGEAAGTYYFSMEFVEGESLDVILAREGKIPVKRALEIVRQVASALDHAHAEDVIHRDIKPQNILIDSGGTAKLTDLGLARIAERQSTGAVVGTPDYMPPEVAQRKAVDSRADIYQLGATLFHMVTGRVPYEGLDSVAVIAKHVRDAIPNPKQYDVTIPDSVCRLIETTIAKNPAMRPSPASVLVEKIDDILKKDAAAVARSSKAAVPAAPAPRPARATRRRVLKVVPSASPLKYALIGGLIVAILAVMAFVFTTRGGGSRTRTRGARARSPQHPRGGKPGTASSPDGTRLDSHDTRHGVDPEAAARAEREAAKRLAEIKQQIAANPSTKLWVGRSLHRLCREFPRTQAANEARRMYRDLVGEERANSLTNSPGPRGRHTPAGVVNEDDAQEAFNKVRLASLEAEADGDFHTARQVLVTFVERYRGSRRAAEARELRERLDARIHRELDRAYKRAEAAAKERNFRRSSSLLKEIIAKDPVGPDRRRARQLLESNETTAATAYEQALARAAPHFRSLAFDEAARVLKESVPGLAGTDYEEQLATAIMSADLGRSFLERSAEKFSLMRSNPPVLRRSLNSGQVVELPVLGVSPEGLVAGSAGAQEKFSWVQFTGKELLSAFELVPLTAEDRLALGAILMSRGSWLLARRQLHQAGEDPAVRGRVEAFLAQVDRGMKTERFDFSHFDQGAAWQTEGDSKWSVRGGAFVHEDSRVGSAALKTRTYRAVGLFLTFEVTFLETIGALEAQLGSGGESVWYSLGSSGYEATCSAGGEEAKARGEWRMRPNAVHRVASVVTKDTLSVSVDDEMLPPLKASAFDRITGHLTFRAQGARLELDNVEIRQVQ